MVDSTNKESINRYMKITYDKLLGKSILHNHPEVTTLDSLFHLQNKNLYVGSNATPITGVTIMQNDTGMQLNNFLGIRTTPDPLSGDLIYAKSLSGETYGYMTIDGPDSVERGFDIYQDGVYKWAIGVDSNTDSERFFISNAAEDTINILQASPNGSVAINNSNLPGVTKTGALNVNPQYFQNVQVYDGSYTDRVNEARTSYGTAFKLIEYSGNYVYVGRPYPFNTTFFDLATLNEYSGTTVIEYSNGAGWTIPSTWTDNTNGFTKSGSISWAKGSFAPAWALTTVNGISAYWMRFSLNFPRKGAIEQLSGVFPNIGSGYAVNDIVNITDGDLSVDVAITAVDGLGGVTGISIVTGTGGYTTGIKATSGGFGSGCTINVSAVSSGRIRTVNMSGANGGTGYKAGDILTVLTGNADAYVRVATVSGGVVTSVDASGSQGLNYTLGVKNTTNVVGTGTALQITITNVLEMSTCYSINPNGSYAFNVYQNAGDNRSTFAIDSTGKALFLDPTSTANRIGGLLPGLTTSKMEILSNDYNRSDMVYYLANDVSAAKSALIMGRSRGTVDAPTDVVNGNVIGGLYGYGYAISSFREGASIEYYVDGSPANNRVPGKINFRTGNTTTGARDAWWITTEGYLISKTTSTGADPSDASNRVSGNGWRIVLNDTGSNTNPYVGFGVDANAGLWSVASTAGGYTLYVDSGSAYTIISTINATAVTFNQNNADTDFIVNKNTSGIAYKYDAGNDTHAFNGVSLTFNGTSFALVGHVHSAADMTSGNLDVARMPIGGTWTLTNPLIVAGNTINISNATDSASSSQGCLTLGGGLGVYKNIYSGAEIFLTRNSEYQSVASVRTIGSTPTPTSAGKKGECGYYNGYKYIWTADNVVVRHVVETTW